MKTHRNIPFFVPHAGCPNSCAFCSQVKITGKAAERDGDEEKRELEELLSGFPTDSESENTIAFFGGSFTAIERGRMTALLGIAQRYISKGIARGIRISTRPDCISAEILDILKYYGVTNIEIGVQSTDDAVLLASGRGHSAKDSFDAAELILKQGFTLCGQMMVGLPAGNKQNERRTAFDIVKMGAAESRIYPTVVFSGTRLYDMTVRGEYSPLTTEDAVERSAECFGVFLDNRVKVLKVGLHSSESLAEAPFGATHPSIGELVKSRVYTNLISRLAGDCSGQALVIEIRKEDVSMLCGYGGAAINRLRQDLGCEDITIRPTDAESFCPRVIKVGVKSDAAESH